MNSLSAPLNLTAYATPTACVEPLDNGWRMSLPAARSLRYRLAELHDYTHRPRRRFPWRPPFTVHLEARVSEARLPGTWGFGLWNNPFGLALGFGGHFLLPALPNAIWFFYASPENWLSFRGNGSLSTRSNTPSVSSSKQNASFLNPTPDTSYPGNGLLAQVFSAPRIPSLLLAAAGLLTSPILLSLFATRTTRRWLRRAARLLIGEEAVRLSMDPTDWHSYRIEWSRNRSVFWVDGVRVLETPVSPRPPLGLILWIDNQFAVFTPQGDIASGVLPNPESHLMVRNLQVQQG